MSDEVIEEPKKGKKGGRKKKDNAAPADSESAPEAPAATVAEKQPAWSDVAAASSASQPITSKEPRFFKDALPVLLSDAERAAKGQQLADLQLKISLVEEEKKAEVARFKEELDGLEEQAKELGTVIRRKKEDREVDCREDFYFETNSAKTTRLDTGEVIKDRPLTAFEREPNGPLFSSNGKPIGAAETLPAAAPEEGELVDLSMDGTEIDNPEGVLNGESFAHEDLDESEPPAADGTDEEG